MFDLTHARHDQLHCLVPNLFRSLKRGDRKKLKLDVTYNYGEGETARFVGFEPLDATDLRVLQGLVAMSGPKGIILTHEPKTEQGRRLRLLLDAHFDATTSNALFVKTTIFNLLNEVGLTDGDKNYKALQASLLRMSNVTILITKNNRQASFHLLSYAIDKDDGRVMVSLNPRIAEAVMGNRNYVRIEMSEVRALQSDPARLIHQRLCAWINAGKSGKIGLDALCEYVWADITDNQNTVKTRRQTVRKSLIELSNMGWVVDEYATTKFSISRPKVKF
jgi:hypothetical protein